MALHSHKFLSVQIYSPKSSHCYPVGGLPINCISDDNVGLLAYESIIHAIERLFIWQKQKTQTAGFLFLHDDVVWKSDLIFDQSQIAHTQELLPSTEWTWAQKKMGWPAIENFNKKYQDIPQVLYGQSDFFYVAAKDATEFAEIGKKMREMSIFLEIAAPTILNSLTLKSKITNSLNLYTQWDERRFDITHTMKMFCTNELKIDIAHPVKLSSVQGILGHIQC